MTPRKISSSPQKERDWPTYNKKMKMRGDIAIWLSPDVIEQWYMTDVYQVTANSAYDTNKTYQLLQEKFPQVDVIIPLKTGSVYRKENAWMRNRR